MPEPWWRDAVIYQIYPRSFADADGDGVGDLRGISSRLDHLVELGVDAVWISPFYTSRMTDGGYDVVDYTDVDPLFGELADAEQLIGDCHARGIRVIVDIVPNHTSSEHEWFREAVAAGPGSPERELYHFRDGKGEHGELPPTNWNSVFGGEAWTRLTAPDGTPEQWYLHLFDHTQPDLNWASEAVRERFDEVLRFWLDRGVDGFRVDVAHSLVKDPAFPDIEEEIRLLGVGYGPMWDQDGVHEVYRLWRRVLDGYEGDRILVAEAWIRDPERFAMYLRPDEMHTAFNFDFLASPWDAGEYRRRITSSMAATASVGAPTTWVLANHDTVRPASWLGLEQRPEHRRGIGPDDPQPDRALGLGRARAAALLELGLPGSAYIYQGEELGMPEHTTLPVEARQDPTIHMAHNDFLGRDGARVPMAWEAGAPALGFSGTGRAWLPQPESYREIAVDRQRGVEGSTFELYREALRLRREFGLGRGGLIWRDDVGDGVLAFENGGVLVIVNVDGDDVPLPTDRRLLLASQPLDGVLPANAACWLG